MAGTIHATAVRAALSLSLSTIDCNRTNNIVILKHKNPPNYVFIVCTVLANVMHAKTVAAHCASKCLRMYT